ncbi:MAG: translation initiation factor IF-2 [Flavobacteriales bacterium]|jgi:translation initiation factor IF-2|nr:translation initiation factor IF-2 [Flavobacteriales bacterium]MDP4717606.1 translation initiation factor IF-2 [Flavobacteriales bacterium]MDP4730707.1 translation initiation factor IF-2 [Flavobacteriales bacterium]MDP4951194.1 translation initiation factor IF-2 [Flavobacteriales bacterium]
MSETKGPQRLGKAATNLNVSKDTIIEFLKKKGVTVDNNPMAKIEGEVYDMLCAEFSTDQKAKEVVQAAATKLRESRESLSISDNKKRKDGESEELSDIDLAKFKRPEAVVEKPKAKAKPVEAPVAPKAEEPVKAVKAKVVEAPVETPAPAVEAPVEAQPEERGNEVKVVGKIDLSALEKPKRGKKAAEPKKEEPKKSKKEEPKVEVPVAKPEPTPETEEVKPEVVEKELIRVNVEKLAGPKLMGKIVLPTTPEKKSPAATAAENKEKRKRKRISKVDIGRQQEIDKRNANKPTRTPYVAQPKAAPTETDIQNQIKETLARLGVGGKSKSSKNRRDKRSQVARRSEQEAARMLEENAVLKLTEFVTVSELATLMSRNATEIIAACMQLGIFASINQRLDAETIAIVAEDFGYQVEFVGAEVTDAITEEVDNEEDLQSRPPVITVMGHVDHGKTSLLDYIRKADVLSGEAGGITQHIGAYTVTLPNAKKITFLDTPGHEAFTAMRARGAQVTDVAIIVIAADDSVMPQTKEAISHAQAAGVPMIFAFNKMDKPEANADRLREQLSQMNILVEEWGGKYQTQEIAAKKGLNIDKLLEKVLLEAEMLDLKANPKKRAIGTIIESSLDKGRGFVATLLVEAGTLRVGDPILAGQYSGRVRAMFNERGGKVEEAGPATPVSILGFEGAPNAGDRFNVLADEREAREIATKRQQLQREQSVRTKKHLTIEEIGRRIALGDFKELNLIVKGDVDGSVEALVDSLQKLSTEKIQVSIIHKGVGQISESDVLLASASDAIIVGFQVRPSQSARKIAENEEIQIKLYSIIYKAIEEIKEAMEGMLSARIEEQITGTAEIREVFKITKVGTIAGCFMLEGKVSRNSRVRVIRDGIVVYTGHLGSLKRFKDDVKEVVKGYECGLNIDKFNDIKEGDLVEAFEEVEVKQTL